MRNSQSKPEYRRMFENKGHRPWWSVLHTMILGQPLKELAGFGYKKHIYVVDSRMSNSSYFEVREMAKATKYFDKLWRDQNRVTALIKEVKKRFQVADKYEKWAWAQDWSKGSDEQLVKKLDRLYVLAGEIFPCMFISQPQHVISLEQRINSLIGDNHDATRIMREATYYQGVMPWTKKELELAKYHQIWDSLPKIKQKMVLNKLVTSYGWLNNIEGDEPFDVEHYEREIKDFTIAPEYKLTGIKLQPEVKKLGALIGELGYLRFWNRWHFMHLRYHIKMILSELANRTGTPELEYTTLEEIKKILKNKTVDFNEIKERKNGYVSILVGGQAKIITGQAQDRYIQLCLESTEKTSEIKGSIANKGKATGRVRIISFSSADYGQQVEFFKKGEILVTGMTRPQIVHLCKKAAAIVTDEGGITSHAAVISREFGLPCVIATHNATKILKTGDLVEVDADQGVVRKIIQ